MIEAETWLKSNDAYLQAAIAAIHDRLERLAHKARNPVPSLPAVITPAQQEVAWLERLFRRRRVAATPPSKMDADTVLVADSEGQVYPAATHREWASEATDDGRSMPAAVRLKELLGLSRFELDVLLLCAAMELHTATAQLCADAQPGSRPWPTFALAMALFDSPAWESVSPDRPLRYWRLVEISQTEGQWLMTSCVRPDERILNYLKGLDCLDDRLAPLLTPLPIPEQIEGPELATSQQQYVEEIVEQLQACVHRGKPRYPVVQLTGPAARSKELVASEAARRLGIGLYLLSTRSLPLQPAELDHCIRLWQRETMLRPVGLVLATDESDQRASSGEFRSAVLRLLVLSHGLVFLDCRDPWSGISGDTLIYDVNCPSSAEQAAAWRTALGEDASEGAARLAGQFNLDLSQIRDIASQQRALGRSALPDLWQACLVCSRPEVELLAKRIVPTATWNDIVLPQQATRTLRELADQVEHRSQVYDDWGFRRKMTRGLGISALFEGKSGCGKSMAAEVIANQLQLDLYRIDLSAVVSKYIGETEKNLRRLFDAAEDGAGILFFDECDSIFGKRTEVKDSHDRYANIEINYLLQRMEAYSGLAILATNMKSALDTAFMRRLRFIVSFPVPGPVERKQIWRRIFPPDTPLEAEDPSESVNYDRLAKVNLTGGGFSNAAVNAAFLAARAGGRVTMSLLSQAIEGELRKMDRPVQPV
jgi:hypothetical protein